MNFTGEFHHTIDAKGRLIVPSTLREELGEDVVLSRWLDRCIAIWSEGGWEEISRQLQALPRSEPAARRFVRQFTSSSHHDAIDRQGRITVPQKLREIAAITRDSVVIGSLDHAEIWDPVRWREHEGDEETDGVFEELAQSLSAKGLTF